MKSLVKVGLFATICLVILALLIWQIEDWNPFVKQGQRLRLGAAHDRRFRTCDRCFFIERVESQAVHREMLESHPVTTAACAPESVHEYALNSQVNASSLRRPGRQRSPPR